MISTILRNAFPYICWEVMVNMLVVMEFCVFIFSNGCLNWKIYSLVQLKTKVTLVIGIRNLLNLLWISCFFFFFFLLLMLSPLLLSRHPENQIQLFSLCSTNLFILLSWIPILRTSSEQLCSRETYYLKPLLCLIGNIQYKWDCWILELQPSRNWASLWQPIWGDNAQKFNLRLNKALLFQ